MYRERCRPKYTATELKRIYEHPWGMQPDWEDHMRRMKVTKRIAQNILCLGGCRTAADLSCGDGRWAAEFPELQWHLGDFAQGYQYRGPIEKTIHEIPYVDIFFFCETIEHLDDPDGVLKLVRDKSKYLILSTPKSFQWDENPEHYWAFDDEAIKEMLKVSGWQPNEYAEANAWGDHTRVNGYCFQVWSAE